VTNNSASPLVTITNGGNLGIATTSPAQKLDVVGNIKISGSGNGLIFPDGTTQTTAASSSSSSGVPSNYIILGTTTVAPSGYTYTGDSISIPAWTSKTNPSSNRTQATAAEVGGYIYYIGGYISPVTTPVATNQPYDPVTDTWGLIKANMPTARRGSRSAVINNKIYVVGGSTAATVSNVNQSFNPSSNSWTTHTAMPAARFAPFAVAIGTTLYVSGGLTTAGTVTSSMHSFLDGGSTWTLRTAMPYASYWGGSAAYLNKMYVAGGLDASGNQIQYPAQNFFDYDPATQVWTQHYWATGGKGDYLKVAGNDLYLIPTSWVYKFNSSTDYFSTISAKPTAVRNNCDIVTNSAVATYAGSIYILDCYGTSTQVWQFNPANATYYFHKKN
jgi:N-acetylneuraminic acid mutarotase